MIKSSKEEVYMTHALPPLPYDYNALEPHIDELTMRLHHTKHHQAYVDNLNKALEGHTALQNKDVEELIRDLSAVPEAIRTAVRNHGGGHLNHSFFWQVMSPDGGSEAHGDAADAIKNAFESFDKFKEQFTNAGLKRFGSGWAWLAVKDGKLVIGSTANQDSPLMGDAVAGMSGTPVLGIDVWEHAYYKKFGPSRADYINAWFNVINWDKVNEYFRHAKK